MSSNDLEIARFICNELNVPLTTSGLSFKYRKDRKFCLVSFCMTPDSFPVNEAFAEVRGWLFNDKNELLVKSFAHLPTEIWSPGQVLEKEYRLLPEGATLHFIKYDGELVCFTFRNPSPENAHFGNAPPFLQAFEQLTGQTLDRLSEQLFDDKPFSRTMHIFTVAHPKYLQAFFAPTSGFVYYVGAYQQSLPFWAGREDVSESEPLLPVTLLTQSSELEAFKFEGLVPPLQFSPELATEMLSRDIPVLELSPDQPAVKLMTNFALQARHALGDMGKNNLEYLTCTFRGSNEDFSALAARAGLNPKPTDLLLTAISPARREELIRAIESIQTRHRSLVVQLSALKSPLTVTDVEAGLAAYKVRDLPDGSKGPASEQQLKAIQRTQNAYNSMLEAARKYAKNTLLKSVEMAYGQRLYDLIKYPLRF